MINYTIKKNKFLEKNVNAYYSLEFKGYENPGNPDFLNHLKNTFDDKDEDLLEKSKEELKDTLEKDLKYIISEKEWKCNECSIITVPRAKNYNKYSKDQLLFIESVSDTAKKLNFIDSTKAIIRHTDVKTTHLKNVENNTGKDPYPGITKETCTIKRDLIENKKIILVDDVYTPNVNVDEDCLQAILDLNPNDLIFYSVAYTIKK